MEESNSQMFETNRKELPIESSPLNFSWACFKRKASVRTFLNISWFPDGGNSQYKNSLLVDNVTSIHFALNLLNNRGMKILGILLKCLYLS